MILYFMAVTAMADQESHDFLTLSRKVSLTE
jgi:hypothetical protein